MIDDETDIDATRDMVDGGNNIGATRDSVFSFIDSQDCGAATVTYDKRANDSAVTLLAITVTSLLQRIVISFTSDKRYLFISPRTCRRKDSYEITVSCSVVDN